jgi:Immunity protein 49
VSEKADFDVGLAVERLATVRERLKRRQGAPAPGPADDPRAQGRHFRVFRDALTAAGLARALGEPEAEVLELLATAARAALELFRTAGTLVTRRTRLGADAREGVEELFVDRSLTNPLRHAQAIYAALASGLSDELEALSSFDPDDYKTEQVEVAPALDAYIRALRLAAGGNSTDSARAGLKRLLQERGGGEDEDERHWLAQAAALERLLEGDAEGTRAALARLAGALESYYEDPSRRDSADRFLKLPVVGLAALARRRGLAP